MYKLIRKIAEENTSGLQLINLPTGSGKTHSTNRFIHDYFANGDVGSKRNVVVVTTNKKNLAFGDLRKMFESSGNADLFDKIFLYLDSISNIVIENYDTSMDDRIYNALGKSRAVTLFLTAVKNIIAQKNQKDLFSAVSEAKQHFAKDIEPFFRKLVRKKLRACKHGYEDRLALIENNPDWEWVAKLYPSVYTRKKKLLFMSADKFVMRNDTIIDASNLVYESMIAENAIIFIDEFDSTKNQILSRLVEESVKNRVDYMDMFQKICQGCSNADLNPEYYHPHEKIYVDLNKQHTQNAKHLQKIWKKHHLGSPIVIDPEMNDTKTFLFRSVEGYIIAPFQNHLSIEFEKNKKRNMISRSSRKTADKKIRHMFDDIDQAIGRYCRLIRSLAYNYYKKKDDPTLSFEDCVYTILDLYGITASMPSYRNYLHKRVMAGSKSPKKFPGVDTSVYENGFGYYAFLDDPSSRERAIIQLLSCPVSAEKVLLKVCERALVFGISATAEFETVLGNYDLNYLKSRLGSHYLPSIADDAGLRNQIDAAYGNYESENICWDVRSISSGADGVWADDLWDNIFEDAKHVRSVTESLSGVPDFYIQRYYSLAFALKSLIHSENKRNGIFFCNMHPTEDSPLFNKEIIRKIFDIIRFEAGKKNPSLSDVYLAFLKSDGFDSEKEKILEGMAGGIRTAIVTSYGTLSTGQNMQFDIPDGFSARNISRYPDGTQMDVDFVYLQTPTHLMHNSESEEYEKELLLHISQINYLRSNGEITQIESFGAIQSALTGNKGDLNNTLNKANNSKSGHMYAAAKLTQAIGRICRTNMKNQEISIYYDENIRRYIDQPSCSYGLVSPEAERFFHHCMNDAETSSDAKRLEELAVFKTRNSVTILNGMLGWHDRETIANYAAMRHDLLCNPSTNELNNTAYQMYVELPVPNDHYWCSYKGEYKNLKISFDGPLAKGCRVDNDYLRFNELFTIPGLKGHFESRGYATELGVGKYLLSPVAAKNILKGIHGEVAGCYIIDPDGIILKGMDEKDFEKFDFQINDDVAVDFKHWSGDLFTSDSTQHKKIIKKMKETGHKTVYVVNILLPEGKSRDNTYHEEDGLRIIKVPWLFDPKSKQFNDKMIAEIRGAKYGKE